MLPAFEIGAIIFGQYGLTLWISLWLLQQRRLGNPRRARRGRPMSSPRMFLVLGLILAWGEVPFTLGLFIGFQAAGWADLFPAWLLLVPLSVGTYVTALYVRHMRHETSRALAPPV